MNTPNDDLIALRVKGPPMAVVKLTDEPDALPGEDIRVKGPPLQVISLTAGTAGASVHLRRPLVDGADAEDIKRRLYSLAEKVHEMELLEGRAGIRIDEIRSGVSTREVVLVLLPNDPTDALATCKRVAHILFHASPGVTLKVFSADKPDTPEYALPA